MKHHPNCPPGWENKCASSHCKSYGRGYEAGQADMLAGAKPLSDDEAHARGKSEGIAAIVADLRAAIRGSWWRRDLGIQDDDFDRALDVLAGRYERGEHLRPDHTTPGKEE